MITTVDKQIDEAVSLREAGNLESAKVIFAALIRQIGSEDKSYLRLQSEYVIQLRLEAKVKLSEALSLSRKLIVQYPNNSGILRALSHTIVDLGGYELALPMLKKECSLFPNNSLKTGEAQAHLALAYLRTGKLNIANNLIHKSIDNIEKNSAKENYVEVRYSYAFIVRSLIEYAMGKNVEALNNAKHALRIATKGKAVHRISEATELVSFLSGI